MKLFILGDTHGNTAFVNTAIKRAQEHECDAIVQLGDFGVWPGPGGDKFLRKVNQYAGEAGIPFYFVQGNHECFPKLYKFTDFEGDFRVVYQDSWKEAAYLFHIPQGLTWEWNGIWYGALGGAASIDKEWRIPGKSWWPEEMTTQEDADKLNRKVDVLFTHDAALSWPYELSDHTESLINRRIVTNAARRASPKLWLHGHMHTFVEYEERMNEGYAKVVGLECDGNPLSAGILEGVDFTPINMFTGF